ETYYLPPMEAVAKVEMIKGAASIQFGSQIGGMINYILKEGNNAKLFDYSTMQTTGSDGLFNSYHAVGGTIKRWNYYTFINYRTYDGWRPNSQQKQLTGYGKVSYQLNQKITIGIEYTFLRNKIKMPGGLTDAQFETNARASVRSRNWLTSPWNVVTASMDYYINKKSSLNIKSTFLYGERSLVWFSALPGEPDKIDSVTGQYSSREVDKELMKSLTTEIRLLHKYNFGKIKNTIATGIRHATNGFDRKEDAPGNNLSNFDMSTFGAFDENFHFSTDNLSAFIENYFKINERFSITPGIRYELLKSKVRGADTAKVAVDKTQKTRGFLLMGIGMQYKTGKSNNIYFNISQSYRPVDYAQLLPFSTVTKVDPDMKDPKGWNADFGIRGNIQNIFTYDIGIYYLSYNNRIGLINQTDANGTVYTLRTNVGKSIHKGIESYVELNITRALKMNNTIGNISIYNSFACINAKYTEGLYRGNYVEYAPEIINRVGFIYTKKWFTASVQFSQQSKSYTDAANTEKSINPVIGRIPEYSVVDWSSTLSHNKFKLKTGINNVLDKKYFTQRTDEYPGPGIIPSAGRSFYIGIGYNL
ncbi:MAG TPA: TonB-dependent receptor, partial [Chitinophagaceae bacterium]|nr:TonB-dependent receptor [Chitinophagaceae bacterium]